TVCPECGSGRFEKEKDILDVWFDSSVSNLKVIKDKKDPWPVDLFLEAVDQHRGWFQLSLIVAMATEKSFPYKACLTHGLVLDANRRKMSKKLGNAVAPEEIWSKYGADILRLWFSSVDYTSDMGFGDEMLSPVVDVYRKIRNSFRFLLGNLADYDDAQNRVAYEELGELEKYVLHRLQLLIQKARNAYEDFKFFKVYHTIHDFCVCLLSQFYFDIMKDVLYTFAPDSKERRASQTVMYDILSALVRLMAPLLSFTCEEVWLSIPGSRTEKSVFLSEMPEPQVSFRNEELAERWDRLLTLRDDVLAALERAREKKMIGNALEARVVLYSGDEGVKELLKKHDGYLSRFFVVSETEVADSKESFPESAYAGRKVDLLISVERARGEKCQRCWTYSESVGESEEFPDICRKCVNAMNEIRGKTRGG
ncbi:MAG: class I tRNA ligase family protein, partial [bacterium]